MTSSDRASRLFDAATIGAAASEELRALILGQWPASSKDGGANDLRVHSVFPSAVNVESGNGILIAVTGPGGAIYPHAIALARPVDFSAWQLERGTPAILQGHSLSLDDGRVVVQLEGATHRCHRSLPAIAQRPPRVLQSRLAAIQSARHCDLRIEALLGAAAARGAAGNAFLAAARSLALGDGKAAVSSLIGLGCGLTPSGDDFLSGFISAIRVRRNEGLLRVVSRAIRANLRSTGEISAFLLRIALRNYWPEPLVDLAEAIAGGVESRAMAALDELCAIGHSSGSDIATGFLFGLHVLTFPGSSEVGDRRPDSQSDLRSPTSDLRPPLHNDLTERTGLSPNERSQE